MFALPSGIGLGLWSRHAVEAAAASAGATEPAFTAPDVDAVHADRVARGLAIARPSADLDPGGTFVAPDPDGHRLRVFRPGWRGVAGRPGPPRPASAPAAVAAAVAAAIAAGVAAPLATPAPGRAGMAVGAVAPPAPVAVIGPGIADAAGERAGGDEEGEGAEHPGMAVHGNLGEGRGGGGMPFVPLS